jgi:hypothetical protein
MSSKNDAARIPGRDPAQWRVRLAADLAADMSLEQKTWGDIDEIILARFDAGLCTKEERARVEQAMRDFPAVLEAVEIARQFPLAVQTASTRRRNVWDTVRASFAMLAARPRLRLGLSALFSVLICSIVFVEYAGVTAVSRALGLKSERQLGASSSSEELAFPPLDAVSEGSPLAGRHVKQSAASEGSPRTGRQEQIAAMVLQFREVKRGRLRP